MKTARTPMRIAKTPRHRSRSSEKSGAAVLPKLREPVHVFCRVRPIQSDVDLSCVRVKNATTVVLSSPENAQLAFKQGTHREIQYIFKNVFEPSVNQHDVYTAVAEPLVENLIRGRNSLLFTYGVTGSGKTFTMTGDTCHRGLMPRCLDALFRTISDYQAKKFVFKPDRLNGFEILSEEDALLERQTEMNQRFVCGGRGALARKASDAEIASQASCDIPSLPGLDEDNMFAVFVTYIEIYNNSVYDLLEEGGIQKTLQSKIIREDFNHKMFVHGVTEMEIKSVEDAINTFQRGQKRKRMGDTLLNAESSRSHSVFNIRLVQAPTDCQGEQVLQDKRTITVSQLSLVDLAGSERSSRTKNTGLRLREAGNINNSLMTLRTCLEYLRENQQQASSGVAPKKIPYRDSKVTHMFKNFFEGEGQVSMIVCINPRAQDYDENTQVLKFAEMTQEVQIARATPIKPDLGLTPGRRKANKMFKIATNNLNDLGHTAARQLEVDVGLVYSLGGGFPDYQLDSPEANEAISDLMEYLKQRIERRKILCHDLENQSEKFRMRLLEVEKENLTMRTEVKSLHAVYKQERERTFALENKLRVHESSIDVLNRKLGNRERQIDELTRKVNEQQHLLSQKEHEKEKQKKKFNAKLAEEGNRKDREREAKLREQRNQLQEKMRIKDQKLLLVSNILKSDNIGGLVRSHSCENLFDPKEQQQPQQKATPRDRGQGDRLESLQTAPSMRTDVYGASGNSRHVRGMAAANSRNRRSRSAGEKWIEHRAPNPVPLGTILQPYLKNRKSITKLTDMKDLTNHKATKYCLVSQEADTDGDVETKLYKGNVIPTCGGGAQVIFDDVECLKQLSPTSSSQRKRTGCSITITDNGNATATGGGTILSGVASASAITGVGSNNANGGNDVGSRCNIGIEGHSSSKKRSKP